MELSVSRRAFYGIVVATLLVSGSAFAIPATWSTSVTPWKHQMGRTLTFHCPGGGSNSKTIYGTGVYTADSGICVAAVHWGMIGWNGGMVTIRIGGDNPHYPGTFRNGIKSRRWGFYRWSFTFLGRPQVHMTGPMMITWNSNASAYRGQIGRKLSFRCPPPPGNWFSRPVYGTMIYTADSRICTAAVHAGRLTPGHGGVVRIEMRPGLFGYSSTFRNGVTSRSWRSYHSSYVFR